MDVDSILHTQSNGDNDEPSSKRMRLEPDYDDERERALAMMEQDDDEVKLLNEPEARRLVLALEKAASRNQSMRIKYPEEPEKFLESEMALDEEIRTLSAIAACPDMFRVIIKLNTIETLMGLLLHENTDIALAVVALLTELTDADAAVDSADSSPFIVLCDAMIENKLLDALMENAARLNEAETVEDAKGVHNMLAVLENIMELIPDFATTVMKHSQFSKWIVARIEVKAFDANKLYCSEILSIMLSGATENKRLWGECGGVDTLLKALSRFKRKDPTSVEELEMVENLFDCLCACLLESSNRDLFLENEGVELLLIMMREKNQSRRGALKALAHALQGPNTADLCKRFVSGFGLKTLSPVFAKIPAKLVKETTSVEEHICSILASLARHLTGDMLSRVLNKFIENDCGKLHRLAELHLTYLNRVGIVDAAIAEEIDRLQVEEGEDPTEEEELDFFMRRVDAGLSTLQTVDCLIASLCDRVEGSKECFVALFKKKGKSLDDIHRIVKEFANNLDDDNEKARLLQLLESIH